MLLSFVLHLVSVYSQGHLLGEEWEGGWVCEAEDEEFEEREWKEGLRKCGIEDVRRLRLNDTGSERDRSQDWGLPAGANWRFVSFFQNKELQNT